MPAVLPALAIRLVCSSFGSHGWNGIDPSLGPRAPVMLPRAGVISWEITNAGSD